LHIRVFSNRITRCCNTIRNAYPSFWSLVSRSDREWGRRVHAVVQLADSTQSLTGRDVIVYAKTRLAAYKVPTTVEFVDQIPRTAATKVNHSAMVEARGG
jgi:bile acid-coenzyme A ligase